MYEGVPGYVDSSLGQQTQSKMSGFQKFAKGVSAISPLIGTGLDVLGGIAQFFVNRKQNRDDRRFQQEMYDKANVYNSPKAQMARLSAAGLNPNLAYGSINKTADVMTPMQQRSLPVPSFGTMLNSSVSQIADLTQKRLQNDLTEVQTVNALQAGKNLFTQGENLKYDSQIKASLAGRGSMSEAQELELYGTTVEYRKQKLMELELNNFEQKLKNSFLPQQQQMQVRESWSRLKMIQSTMGLQAVDKALKQEALKLRKDGIEVNDSFILRFFSEYLGDLKTIANPK